MSFWLHLSEDHRAVPINGNKWKALTLSASYQITPATIMIMEGDVFMSGTVDFATVRHEANVLRGPEEPPGILQ